MYAGENQQKFQISCNSYIVLMKVSITCKRFLTQAAYAHGAGHSVIVLSLRMTKNRRKIDTFCEGFSGRLKERMLEAFSLLIKNGGNATHMI